MGTARGGWFATLLDSAMACPVHSTEGRLIHSGRQVATAEGRLVGADGKLYAHGSTTCLVFDQAAY